jgi:hypothetical protein
MVDNVDPVQQEIPGIAVPGEQVPTQKQENQEPQYTEIEQRAMEQGWRPKDDWDGAPDDWRDARTYIDRGELLGKLKTQSSELKEVKNMLAYMSEHNKRVYAAGYQKAIVDLKAQRIAAMKDENFEAVAAIEEAIDQNKEALTQIQRQPPVMPAKEGPDKELEAAWMAKNPWYKNDKSLKVWANGMAMEYARTNVNVTEEEIYEFLSKEVRREFPHKFKRAGAPSPDGEGSRPANSGSTKNVDGAFEKLLATLPEDHARAARSLVKSGVVSKEKYVQDYDQIGGR